MKKTDRVPSSEGSATIASMVSPVTDIRRLDVFKKSLQFSLAKTFIKIVVTHPFQVVFTKMQSSDLFCNGGYSKP